MMMKCGSCDQYMFNGKQNSILRSFLMEAVLNKEPAQKLRAQKFWEKDAKETNQTQGRAFNGRNTRMSTGINIRFDSP
jgi:hypothetical protein